MTVPPINKVLTAPYKSVTSEACPVPALCHQGNAEFTFRTRKALQPRTVRAGEGFRLTGRSRGESGIKGQAVVFDKSAFRFSASIKGLHSSHRMTDVLTPSSLPLSRRSQMTRPVLLMCSWSASSAAAERGSNGTAVQPACAAPAKSCKMGCRSAVILQCFRAYL